MTLVYAEAGYGKTTALAGLRAQAGVVYVRMRPERRDPARFLTELARTVGVDGERAQEQNVTSPATALAGGTVSMLILDEVEHLGGSAVALRAIDSLLDRFAGTTHVVLSGRRLPATTIARIADRDDLLRVTAGDLAFTTAETAEVLGRLADADLEAIHRLTGGWPAVVRCAARWLDPSHDGSKEPLGPALATTWRTFAQAVFDRQDDRSALAALAATGPADPRLLACLGVSATEREWTDLRERGVVVDVEADAGAFQIAPALAEVARAATDSATSRVMHAAAGQWWERADRMLFALEAYAGADDDALAAFLVRHGHELVRGGAASQVRDLASRWSRPGPELTAVLADASWQLGDWAVACASLDRAEHAAGADGLPASGAWRFGALLYLTGERSRAESVLGRARENSPGTADHALVLAWLAAALWRAGRIEEADECAQEAVQQAWACDDHQALAAAEVARALVCAARGDRPGNTLAYRSALHAAEAAGDTLQAARIHANLASKALEEGEYAVAVDHADRAVLAAGPHAPIIGLALENKAAALLHLGRLDAARAAAAAAAETYATSASSGSAFAAAGPQVLLGDIYRQRGDQVQARLAFERALRAGELAEDTQVVVSAAAGLAWVLAREDPVAAAARADQALGASSALGRAEALNAAAWVALVADQRGAAASHAAAAEVEAQRTDERAALATALELQAAARTEPARALLGAALAVWTELNDPVAAARCRLTLGFLAQDAVATATARHELADLGAAADVGVTGLLCGSGEPGGHVSIATLGRFVVTVDGAPVPARSWQSRQARDLLKLLVARGGRPVSREAAADILWPNESYETVGPRLSVLLSRLRALLDPDRVLPSNHYLDSDKQSVALRTDRMHVDVVEFLSTAQTAIRWFSSGRQADAEPQLRAAEQLYVGDFLDDDRDCDWAIDRREQARAAATECARLLARLAARRGEDEQAARWLQRLLERDPYDEDAWTALIAGTVRLRRHGEARHHYASYTRRMHELDVPIAAFGTLTDRMP